MKQNIAIIGAGNVGIGLAHLFSKNGFEVKLGSREPKSAQSKINEVAVCSISDALKNADLVLLTVPDSQIQSVCESLATQFKQGCVVLHCSGAINSQALLSAQLRGCLIASAHPLNTFPNPAAAIRLFNQSSHNTYLYCEGDAAATELINTVFSTIGFNYIAINAAAKPLYHAACVFACNYLTVLMDVSLQTAETAELDRDIFWRSIQPLVKATLTNINSENIANSLSGPIARADIETVQTHIQSLGSVSNELRNTYIDLASHAITLAKNNDNTFDQKLSKLNEIINLIKETS